MYVDRGTLQLSITNSIFVGNAGPGAAHLGMRSGGDLVIVNTTMALDTQGMQVGHVLCMLGWCALFEGGYCADSHGRAVGASLSAHFGGRFAVVVVALLPPPPTPVGRV